MSQNLLLPLPLYDSYDVGSVAAKDGELFQARIGMDKALTEQLKQKSLDETDDELQRNTSDKKRFGQIGYETWYAKDRTVFTLTDSAGNLAAIIWLGPDPLPQFDVPTQKTWATIAFRSYAPYRGKGLMKAFSILAIDSYKNARPEHQLWLETNADNEAGRRLYEKLGFTELGVRKSNGRLVMAMGS